MIPLRYSAANGISAANGPATDRLAIDDRGGLLPGLCSAPPRRRGFEGRLGVLFAFVSTAVISVPGIAAPLAPRPGSAARQESPERGAVLTTAAQALRADHPGRARRVLVTWLRSHPRDLGAVRLLGRAEFTMAEAMARRAESLAVREAFARARRTLELSEELAPGTPTPPPIHHAIGYCHYVAGRFPEAIARFTSALSGGPLDVSALRMRGICHRRSGNLEQAEADLRSALSRNTASVDAALALAALLDHGGRTLEAEAVLRDTLGGTPTSSREDRLRLRERLFRLALSLNRIAQATAEVRALRALAPSRSEYRVELGILLYRSGRPEEALQELAPVLAGSAEVPDHLLAKAYHQRGLIALQRNELEIARADFERARSLAPHRAATLRSLAAVLRRSGEDARARTLLGEFYRVQRIDGRIHDLRRRLGRDPLDLEARVELIETLLRLGGVSEARAEVVALRRAAPEHPRLPDLERATAPPGRREQ